MKVFSRKPTLWCHPIVLGVVFATLAAVLGAQQGGPDQASEVRIFIETDHASYGVGDSIMVRLTVRNTSDHPILFQHMTYTGLVDLKVIDQASRPIPPTVLRLGVIAGGPLRTLKAGGAMTLLHWRAPLRNWLNLRDWGYDIRKPGRYKIIGTSRLGGAPGNATQMSNEATILIESR